MSLRIALISLLAFSSASSAQTVPPVQRSPDGRYQLFFSPHMRSDTFLVDTATGRVWRMVGSGQNDGAIVFEGVEVEQASPSNNRR